MNVQDFETKIKKFAEDGAYPGAFVAALIANDLRAALVWARGFNLDIRQIRSLLDCIWQTVPPQAVGSYANMRAYEEKIDEINKDGWRRRHQLLPLSGRSN